MRTLLFALVSLCTLMPAALFAQSFSIRSVAFDDSVYLDDAALATVAADYTGRSITFEDLQAMVEEINALYAAAGVVTARAILPPQEIRNGVLRVQLVEATIDQVNYDGLDQTDPEFLRRSILIEPGQKPDFDRLEQELRRFEVAHDFRPVLLFAPGATPGTSTASISGEEPPRYQFTASLDNFGSEATGSNRLTLFGQVNSLTGVRDTLTGQIQLRFGEFNVTDGAYSGYISYSRPVNGRGGRVVGSALFQRSEVIAGPFAGLAILSDNYSLSLGYSQPVRVRADNHWLLEGDVIVERSKSNLSGVEFSDVELRELQLATTWTRIRPGHSIVANVGLKVGQSESQDTSETEGSYQLLYGALGYSRIFGDRVRFSGDVNFQFAPDQNLPIARLFNVGGSNWLRGYPEAVRSGDSGLVARFQVSPSTPYTPGQGRVSYTPFGFTDLGLIVPFRPDGSFDSDQDFLASVGAGVRARFTDDLSGVLMLATPLRETLGFDDTNKAVAYFWVGYDF